MTETRRADAVAATCITLKKRRVQKKSKPTMVALVEEGRLTFHRTSGKCATLGAEEGGEEGKLARTTWRSCCREPAEPTKFVQKNDKKGKKGGKYIIWGFGACLLLPQTYNYSCRQDNFAPSHHVARRQRFGFAYLRNARSAQFIWVPIFLCTFPPCPRPYLRICTWTVDRQTRQR